MLRFTSAIAFILLTLPCLAHEDGHHGHGDHDHEHSEAEASPDTSHAKGVMLPAVDGPKPWSDAPVLNDADRFQIAVMTDRTGGHRPGIWMDAVRKVNMLRPEFVMSVGDLIEGYTENEVELQRQWKEFLGFIDQMEMKFFFVAGNHDLTNPRMHRIWREKFGREYYSFDYKRVHFVCLCSEDPVNRISDKQLAWLADDLGKHADARWTLVFLHKPLWTYAERSLASSGSDNTNWKNVEKLLADRKHTVFAGHVHHYVQYERNKTQYYSLATTGGGSRLRGNDWGEFDHITWLTMEKDGPHVVNLRLDGILPADVVTEKSAARFRSFVGDVKLEVAPILMESGTGFTEGEISIRLTNNFDVPIEAVAEIDGLPLRGLTVEPSELKLTAGPSGTATQTVQVRFAEQIDFPSLAQTVLTAKVVTAGGDRRFMAERIVPVVIDKKFTCPTITKLPEIDGTIDEGIGKEYGGKDFSVDGSEENYKGAGDLAYTVRTATTEKHLYVAISVTDDKVLPAGDGIELLLDPRSASQRRLESSLRWNGVQIKATAPDEDGNNNVSVRRLRRGRSFTGVKSAAKRTDAGYDIELAIPTNYFDQLQSGPWQSVQIGSMVRDIDDADEEPTELWWRGVPGRRIANTGHALFARESEN